MFAYGVPPVDGQMYPTKANRIAPRDFSAGLPPGTIEQMGTSRAEAIYKAVAAMHERAEAAGLVFTTMTKLDVFDE